MNKICKAINVIYISLFFFIIGCANEGKDTCHEFNYRYSRLTADMGDQPDTLILLQALNGIIEKDPLCVDAYLIRGDINISLKKQLLAEYDYEKVLKIDSGNVYALYKMGLLLQYKELYDSSISFFNKAISVKTHGNFIIDYPKVSTELGTGKNKYDIIAVELLYRLGVSYYYRRNLQLALGCFNSCIDNKYVPELAYLYRGAIYIELNKPEKACDDFLQAKYYGNKDAVSYLAQYCKKK